MHSDTILESLTLESLDNNLYQSVKPLWHPLRNRGIYGGALIAQALSAAVKTVPDNLHVHCLQANFVKPYASIHIPNNRGNSSIPIIYSVEATHDGRSFAIRTVRSFQTGKVIVLLTASFHSTEAASVSHNMPSPIALVPAPEAIEAKHPEADAKAIYHEIIKTSEISETETRVNPTISWARDNGLQFLQSLSKEFRSRPIDFRYVSNGQMRSRSLGEPTDYRQYVWFRANGCIPDDRITNSIVLAYASDHDLINTALRAHEKTQESDINVMVSLNHIVYFHQVILQEFD